MDPRRMSIPRRLARMTELARRDARALPVQRIAGWVREKCRYNAIIAKPGWVRSDWATVALEMLSALRVCSDPPGQEVFASPLYTLWCGEGDCLNQSGAALAVLFALGYTARLVHIVVPDGPEDHVALEVLLQGGYRLADPLMRPFTWDAVSVRGRWRVAFPGNQVG